jgi:hypothetical protein
MNTRKLCILVQHAARFGKVEDELYADLHKQLGLRPVNLMWGAACLYIDLPDEVKMSVPYTL